MSAWNCRSCSVFYPGGWPAGVKCPICTGPMRYFTGENSQEDWESLVLKAGKPLLDDMGRPVEGGGPAPAGPHPADDECRVMGIRGRLYVPDAALKRLGYDEPEDLMIVRLNGTYYELIGRAYTPKLKKILWWIEEPELSDLAESAVVEVEEPLFVEVILDENQE